MACFVVSTVAAVGVTVAKHIVAHNEKNKEQVIDKFGSDIKWSKKLKYLELALWSGSFMLAGEHMIHGEVTAFPPFLTAASSAEETQVMLQEMGTVGVAMLGLLVLTWALGVLIYDYIAYSKRTKKSLSKEVK